ncbi:hypothetical protein H310_07423 [Aphanomyces invadans]|uniref:Elongator complex protein 5 n=1 Tax=Aphanomyces invadans TaxID=157072 RepID=A0A024U269_9STRA|nr:hypothetical protein H310_07423 [Aphanomyces invadans]ETV99971.1 hypothetical protein H310_07423 [Aphanomyces invadans]|eukprot:XP_008871389.1 hypothetical protein H310_07423 [Aphanomyces invadans]
MSPTRVDLLDEISAVDAHFRLKCIPAALGEAVSNHGKAKTTPNFVLVEDRQGCAGAGRVMLQHIVDQLALSARTKHFVHVHLETDNGAPVDGTTSSHHHIHYAGDIGGWFAVDKTASLLERIRRDVEAQVHAASSLSSVLAVVVVIDSLSALLQQFTMKAVSSLLTQLHQSRHVIAVASRVNASLHKPAVALCLRSLAKTIVSVDMAASLASYPLFSIESKRRVPVGMHGLVILIRKLANGQTTDVTEYFEFFPRDDEMPSGTTRSLVMHTQQVAEQRAKAATQTQATDTPLGTLLSDLTFNLNVTRRDDDSRRQVVLPYQHQGNPPPHRGDMPLFYIDQDDPDWDDDDLDDDLDI